MKLCVCSHDESAHANDTGYCFADKRNGDPCECERFTADQAAPEIPAQQLVGSHYIGQEEKAYIEQRVIHLAALCITEKGRIPEQVAIMLINRECGPQRLLVFELIVELRPFADGSSTTFYREPGPFEFGGVPGQDWTVRL